MTTVTDSESSAPVHGSDTTPVGVLLMAYGTPRSPDEVEPYFTHIRGGRRPSPEAVERLRERYARVGGKTPLLEITAEVARKLQARLQSAGRGRYRVYFGMKHWHPFIADVVARIAADGVRRVIAIPLAPHYSHISIGGYQKAVEEALTQSGNGRSEVVFVQSWHRNELFRAMMARLVREGLHSFPAAQRHAVTVVFSAHSLPERIRQWNDPYERELLDSCAGVARLAGVADWRFAFQSAGSTGEPWLGPDIVDYLEQLYAEGRRYVLQVPIGFVCDHLEILWDIDIEARQWADELGMTLHRTQLPNAHDEFIGVLASIVLDPEPWTSVVASSDADGAARISHARA